MTLPGLTNARWRARKTLTQPLTVVAATARTRRRNAAPAKAPVPVTIVSIPLQTLIRAAKAITLGAVQTPVEQERAISLLRNHSLASINQLSHFAVATL